MLPVLPQEVQVIRDCGLWGGITVEKKISKNFELNLEQQLRSYNNSTQLDDYILDLGGKYKLNKTIRLGLNLRYTYDASRWDEADNEFRYNLDFLVKYNITDFLQFNYRLRYQQCFTELFASEGLYENQFSAVRNRVKLDFELSRIQTFYGSAELFRMMEPFHTPCFNKLRFFLGDEIDLKKNSLDIALGMEKDLQSTYQYTFFFISTFYKFRL